MIEQEQRAREGNTDDAEDDKNIDEIFAYIQNQQGSNPQLDDFSLPDEADDEYEAMMQQHQHYQQPFYGYPKSFMLLFLFVDLYLFNCHENNSYVSSNNTK